MEVLVVAPAALVAPRAVAEVRYGVVVLVVRCAVSEAQCALAVLGDLYVASTAAPAVLAALHVVLVARLAGTADPLDV